MKLVPWHQGAGGSLEGRVLLTGEPDSAQQVCVPEKIALKLNFYKWNPISAMIYNTISKILYLHFEVMFLML